jgi:hypothetical protein
MRVLARYSSFKGIPREWVSSGTTEESQLFLTKGRGYDVHAISASVHDTCYLIINDENLFRWEYSWMFEILEGTIPSDWIVGSLPTPYDRDTIIGPSFLTSSVEVYSDIAEGLQPAINLMWDRWEQIQRDRADRASPE